MQLLESQWSDIQFVRYSLFKSDQVQHFTQYSYILFNNSVMKHRRYDKLYFYRILALRRTVWYAFQLCFLTPCMAAILDFGLYQKFCGFSSFFLNKCQINCQTLVAREWSQYRGFRLIFYTGFGWINHDFQCQRKLAQWQMWKTKNYVMDLLHFKCWLQFK